MENPDDQPANRESEAPQAQPDTQEQSGYFRSDGANDPSFAAEQLSEDSVQYEGEQDASESTISWTASESVDHNKNAGWYAALLFGICGLAALIWLITKDLVTPAVVLVCGFMLAGFAATQPRQLKYQMNSSGLTVGNRHYSYNDFKSFTLIHDGAISSVMLRPLKRFGAWTTIYFEPKDEDNILDILSSRLPHENHQPDAVDKLLRKIRF